MSTKFSDPSHIQRARIDSIVENFSHHNDMPHVILHGPPGSGKKTLCRIILSNLYGKNSSEKVSFLLSVVLSLDKSQRSHIPISIGKKYRYYSVF